MSCRQRPRDLHDNDAPRPGFVSQRMHSAFVRTPNASLVAAPTGIPQRCVPPQLVTTTFGLDTAATYLEENADKQEAEAAVQATNTKSFDEIELARIQDIVNGDRVIKAEVRDGRLVLRDPNRKNLANRSLSAVTKLPPDSEEEEWSPRSSKRPPPGFKKLRQSTSVASSISAAAPCPESLKTIARAMSCEAPEGEVLDLNTMYEFFIGQTDVSTLSTWDKYEALVTKAAQMDAAIDGRGSNEPESADSGAEASSSSQPRAITFPRAASTSSSQTAASVEDVSDLPTPYHASDTSISSKDESFDHHILSFEKHASEARSSTRPDKGKGKAKDFYFESGDSSPTAPQSSLRKKINGVKKALGRTGTTSVSAPQQSVDQSDQSTSKDQVRGLVDRWAAFAADPKLRMADPEPMTVHERVFDSFNASNSDSHEQAVVNDRAVNFSGTSMNLAGAGHATNSTEAIQSQHAFSAGIVSSDNPEPIIPIDPLLISIRGTYDSEKFVEVKTTHIDKANIKETQNRGNASESGAKKLVVTVFDYHLIVPEKLPQDIVIARENCEKIWSVTGLDNMGKPDTDKRKLWYGTQFTLPELDPDGKNLLKTADRFGEYPRSLSASDLPKYHRAQPVCHSKAILTEIPAEILPEVCKYLSSQEIRKLRLVNRATASAVMPLMIRSTVIAFGPRLFDSTDGGVWDSKSHHPSASSILKTSGREINKFGISFEYDLYGLANAERKIIEEVIDTWWGEYIWPTKIYPRFAPPKALEDLVECDRPLLKNTMNSLRNVTELALSVDSGHGWLVGPDMSDMAMLRKEMANGGRVFGKNYNAPDRRCEFAIRRFFEWAQLNTHNALQKEESSLWPKSKAKLGHEFRQPYKPRPYDDYLSPSLQPDANRHSHVGGVSIPSVIAPELGPPFANLAPINTEGSTWHNPYISREPQLSYAGNSYLAGLAHGIPPSPAVQYVLDAYATDTTALNAISSSRAQLLKRYPLPPDNAAINPQWPLIFSCMNLAAGVGGDQPCVQERVSHPSTYPIMPGYLTETHAQWLLETLYAQRAFLISYTNSVINNAGVFKNVQKVVFAKLSSGLVSFLAQKEFWAALPNLKDLTLMVIPDWNQEYLPGDKRFYRNMPISPVEASIAFNKVLRETIGKIENLSALTVGFVGGGEHQTGLYGRNRHVLPAPIVSDPDSWVHHEYPDWRSMSTFNHIRNLTFVNCWFTPNMLQVFMKKSRDTSLHHLTLDSVSLTGVHEAYASATSLIQAAAKLRCRYEPEDWLFEEIPRNACWINSIEKIVPCQTITDQKYDAGLINTAEHPRPERLFRGNIKKITFNSCGYVKISRTRSSFAQDGVLEHHNSHNAMDEGLKQRLKHFRAKPDLTRAPPAESAWQRHERDHTDKSRLQKECIMMSMNDSETKHEYFGLGRLTQCVHAIEKRLLESAWGMTFGWGEDMERWASVEDGWFEGGTGRFSGMIQRDGTNN